MAKMIVIYNTPKDVEAFDKHYFGTHIPLAKKLPGLIKYEVSEGPIIGFGGVAPTYRIGVLQFESLAAIQATFGTEIGQACAEDRAIYAPNDEDFQMYLLDEKEV
jgi:uncharacterized protein (TIGR02118 family)